MKVFSAMFSVSCRLVADCANKSFCLVTSHDMWENAVDGILPIGTFHSPHPYNNILYLPLKWDAPATQSISHFDPRSSSDDDDSSTSDSHDGF
jgi:hypothetical protein